MRPLSQSSFLQHTAGESYEVRAAAFCKVSCGSRKLFSWPASGGASSLTSLVLLQAVGRRRDGSHQQQRGSVCKKQALGSKLTHTRDTEGCPSKARTCLHPRLQVCNCWSLDKYSSSFLAFEFTLPISFSLATHTSLLQSLITPDMHVLLESSHLYA